MSLAVVITTIQAPTPGVIRIAEGMSAAGHEVFVVGDRKSPREYGCAGVTYLDLADQARLGFALEPVLRHDSYTRKMLGYLRAFSDGIQWLRETDDDNLPYESFFDDPEQSLRAREPKTSGRWINPYAYFTDRFTWPRGLPLNAVRVGVEQLGEPEEVAVPVVVQAVADGDPDVDAVYRLTSPDTSDIRFDSEMSLLIPSACWAPFNSQATTWPRELFALMYLPGTCSFRMTDIWRSFIAQRVMREVGSRLVFTGPTVFQERNAHDLMRDFRDEAEGYLGYDAVVDALEATALSGMSLASALRTCYVALCERGLISWDEMPMLDAWISDIRDLGLDGLPS